ncbi:MAG: hypothetical protein WC796_02530 [Candidatus Pacearchaeota archaeon]|jgi:hypothetical protein
MNQKLIVALAIALPLVIIFSYIASAEITWSNPTSTTFSTTTAQTDDNKDTQTDKTTNSCKDKKTTIKTEDFYGEWQCTSGKLQRTVIINGVQKIETGEVCGINLDADDESSNIRPTNLNSGLVVSSSFMIYPIILVILVLMSIIGVALITLIK